MPYVAGVYKGTDLKLCPAKPMKVSLHISASNESTDQINCGIPNIQYGCYQVYGTQHTIQLLSSLGTYHLKVPVNTNMHLSRYFIVVEHVTFIFHKTFLMHKEQYIIKTCDGLLLHSPGIVTAKAVNTWPGSKWRHFDVAQLHETQLGS